MSYALILLAAWRPQFFSSETLGLGLDSGWRFALHAFHAKGLQYGPDVVFTYGPLGFLEPRFYHPDTYLLVLLRSVAFALVFWFALWSYARQAGWNVLVVGLWVAVLTTLSGMSIRADGHQSEYFLCALLLLVHFDRRHLELRPAWWLLTAALALASLIKFSYLVSAVAVIVVVTFDELARRRLPKALIAFTTMYAFLYVGSGQRPSSWLSYFNASSDLAAAYSLSMATAQSAFGVIAFVVAAVALVLVAVRSVSVTGLRRALFTVGFTATLWVLFKQGYVRHDVWHGINASVELLMLVILCVPIVLRGRRAGEGQLLWFVAVLPAVLLTWIMSYNFFSVGPEGQLRLMLAEVRMNVTASISLIREGTEPLRRQYVSAVRELAARAQLNEVQGSVDVYMWDAWLPLIHDVDYKPRPVFQSYAAFTPKLAEMNARHLIGSSGPQTLVFDVKTIDRRLPTIDDAPSWPIVLNGYEVRSVNGSQVTLSRLPLASRPAMRPVRRFVGRIGEPFALPDLDDPIMLAVDVKPSFLGKLWSAAYKGPVIAMDVWTRNGVHRSFRYVQSLDGVPFVISPLITDTPSFLELARGTANADRLVERVSFRIGGNDEWRIDPQINVTISAVDLHRSTNGRN